MKNLTIKIILVAILIGLTQIKITNSFYLDSEKSIGNILTTSCWTGPIAPELLSPSNGYIAGPTSTWYLNPVMDWNDSWACPGKTVQYQYESYSDSGLTNRLYQSSLLNNSTISAAGTPDGSYYWRVRAFDGEYWSDWSGAWLLVVDSTHVESLVSISEPTVTLSPTPTVFVSPDLNYEIVTDNVQQ